MGIYSARLLNSGLVEELSMQSAIADTADCLKRSAESRL